MKGAQYKVANRLDAFGFIDMFDLAHLVFYMKIPISGFF